MRKAFRDFAGDVGEAIKWVVMKTAIAFAGVANDGEIAVSAVDVIALQHFVIFLQDAMRLQPALIVVLILAKQIALLALQFASGTKLMRGQA